MKNSTRLMTTAALLVLSGCNSGADFKSLPLPELPTELSDNYKKSFENRPERTAKQFIQAYDGLAKNGPVTKARLVGIMQLKAASIRAQYISQILSADINGDGQITRNELDIASAQKYWAGSSLDANDLLSIDKNEDGILSLREVFIYGREYNDPSKANGRYASTGRRFSMENYLGLFDLDLDGTVTREEMLEAFAEFYTEAKGNQPKTASGKTVPGNTWLKPQKKFKKPEIKQLPKLTKNCEMPTLGKSHQLIGVSGYEGKAIPNVAIGGQDEVAYAAHLTIEAGSEPLYIVATSHQSIVWILDGDTKRVKQFVTQTASSNRDEAAAGVGVVGLNKDIVTFLEKGCLSYFFKPSSKNAILFKGKVNAKLGRKPSVIMGEYGFTHYGVPSGKSFVTKKQRKNDDQAWWSHKKYTHDGTSVSIPIKDIVAPKPLETFEILPNAAGIESLVRSGALEKIEKKTYLIVKAFPRFPAGLYGGNSVTFILGEGIDMPEGSGGHSKIYSEETGEQIEKKRR